LIPRAVNTVSKSVLTLLAAIPKPAEPATYIPCANADVAKSAPDTMSVETIVFLVMKSHLFKKVTLAK
jgi:hypothetical protein